MPSPFPGMDPYLEDEARWPDFRHHLAVILERHLSAWLSSRYTVHRAERQFQDGLREQREEYLHVRERAGGRVVTLLDLVSPAHKHTEAGREAYLATRREARETGASAVEIDLVLGGRPLLDYSRDGLPAWDYAVTVTRDTHPERYEIYTSTLSKRLPRFKVPLAADDRDAVLDLQAAFAAAYDAGSFAGRVDYGRPPGVSLGDEQRTWMAEVLRGRAA
jgi:hypothetical protein